MVATLTTEAEIVLKAEATKEIIWICHLYSDFYKSVRKPAKIHSIFEFEVWPNSDA